MKKTIRCGVKVTARPAGNGRVRVTVRKQINNQITTTTKTVR